MQAADLLVGLVGLVGPYLGQRLKLTRQNRETKEPTVVDLSGSKEEVSKASDKLLQDVAAECGSEEVNRVLELIRKKRDLIWEWEERKVSEQKAVNRGKLEDGEFELRQRDREKNISQTLVEIERYLKGLGIQIEKEAG